MRKSPLTDRARNMRRDPTDAENRLWYALKNRSFPGLKFVRQLPIGPYIADFACREKALVVELDGGQHADSTSDVHRTAYLNAQGYSVVRFWNPEVFENRNAVLEAMGSVLDETPSPGVRFAPATLSPTGRGIRGERAASAAFAARSGQSTAGAPLPSGERPVRRTG